MNLGEAIDRMTRAELERVVLLLLAQRKALFEQKRLIAECLGETIKMLEHGIKGDAELGVGHAARMSADAIEHLKKLLEIGGQMANGADGS